MFSRYNIVLDPYAIVSLGYTAVQRQTAVAAYLKSKQLLLFVFAWYSSAYTCIGELSQILL